jgi:hypothetical protein
MWFDSFFLVTFLLSFIGDYDTFAPFVAIDLDFWFSFVIICLAFGNTFLAGLGLALGFDIFSDFLTFSNTWVSGCF